METSKSRIGFAFTLLAAVAVSGISVDAQAEPITKRLIKRIANQEITKRAESLRGSADLVGLVGPTGPAGADGQPGAMGPVGALYVHDVNGVLLGTFTGMHGEGFSLYNQAAGLLLKLNRSGDLDQSITYHTTPDCTGTPYLPADSTLFAGVPVRTGHNGDYQFVSADPSRPVVVIISTIQHPPGNGGQCETIQPCSPGQWCGQPERLVIEAIPADLSALPFTLPVARPLTVQ